MPAGMLALIVDALALAPTAVKEPPHKEMALSAFVTKNSYDGALMT